MRHVEYQKRMTSSASAPPLRFRGVAHPPAGAKRNSHGDLSRAEIHALSKGQLGKSAMPVCVEHDRSRAVGTVHASYRGPNGELCVAGVVRDAEAAAAVRRGDLRGLSLGTGVTTTYDDSGQSTHLRTQEEISLCSEPRRSGCYIHSLDGETVRTVVCASKGGALHASPSPPPPLRCAPFALPIPLPV